MADSHDRPAGAVAGAALESLFEDLRREGADLNLELTSPPGFDAAKELLILETYALNREIGYAGFRRQCFDDPDALGKWLDPIAWGELRSFWDAQGDYVAYRRDFVDVGIDQLVESRDYLRGILAAGEDAQVAFYHRVSGMGHGARLAAEGLSHVSTEAQPVPSPGQIARTNSPAAPEHDNGRGR
jgi:hypothetical protein